MKFPGILQVSRFLVGTLLSLLASLEPGFAQVVPDPSIYCSYKDERLTIITYPENKKVEHFYPSGSRPPLLLCAQKRATAIIGNQWIYVENGNFHSKYISDSESDSRQLNLQGTLASAVIGNQFIVTKNGTDIFSKYINDGGSNLLVSNQSMAATIGFSGTQIYAWSNGEFLSRFLFDSNTNTIIRSIVSESNIVFFYSNQIYLLQKNSKDILNKQTFGRITGIWFVAGGVAVTTEYNSNPTVVLKTTTP